MATPAMAIDPPLFASEDLTVRVLQSSGVPALQALFDANPLYFQALNGRNALAGVVNVLSDFCAAGVWHLALFLLATRLHGAGLAGPLHQTRLDWALQHGARWLRLSVIAGHARAERFWARLGDAEVRRREGVACSPTLWPHPAANPHGRDRGFSPGS